MIRGSWHSARRWALATAFVTMARAAIAAIFATLSFGEAGCTRSRAEETPRPVSSLPLASGAPRSTASHAAEPPPEDGAAAPTPARTHRPETAPDTPPPPTRSGPSPFVIDELVDVGPAGPATAHERGVVMIDKHDELVIAERGRFASGSKPRATPIATLDRRRPEFARFGRGPAILGNQAYWISGKRLVRKKLEGGTLDVLREDARPFTRVAGGGAVRGTPAFVAYVTDPDANDTPHARLWVEGGKVHELTPEGAGTNSVALAARDDDWLLVSLDGRSGMTPLHARAISAKGSELTLGQDFVAWVGASAQPTTEVFVTAAANDAWALLAIDQDALHFGLAQVHIGNEPRVDVPSSFSAFPNGANSAPIATATLCGRAVVAFARPSAAEPGSPAELVLAEIGPSGVELGEVVAHSRGFADASLAAVNGGGLLVYTADFRTWAVAVRCRR